MQTRLNNRRDAEGAENLGPRPVPGRSAAIAEGALDHSNLSMQSYPLRTGTVRAPKTPHCDFRCSLRLSVRTLRTVATGWLLLLSLTIASAQIVPNADEFFHNGAQQYLTNNVQGALLTVTNGLQQFPDDVKLKKLWELLNQQQQSQSQEQKDQEQKQDQKDQGQQKDQKDQQSKNDQQKKEDEQKQQQAQNSKDQEKQDQKNQSGKPEKSDEQKQQEAQAMQAHAMTAQEAKQLLDAQKDKEQVLIFKPQGEPKKAQSKPVKDW